MKMVTAAAIIVLSLTPIAALSAADPSAGGPGASTGDRDDYIRTMRQHMQDWQTKLHDLGETAAERGRQAGSTAEAGLKDAWVKTQAASRRLQTASAEGWDRAKASYEAASRDLAAAWHRLHPDE